MDLIVKIKDVRDSIKALAKSKRKSENEYKTECTKYGIKPKSKEETDEMDLLSAGDSRMRSMKVRSDDDETLSHMRKDADARNKHIEMLKSSVEDSR